MLYSFFAVQQKSGPYADKFYLEEHVINKIPTLKEKIQKLKQDIANAGDNRLAIEYLEKQKDGLEGALRQTKHRMDTVWKFLEPDIVDTIEVVSRRNDFSINTPSNRFYGYHFK